MNQRVKRTQRDYTLAFKQAVVDEVERGELTYKQAQARHGIQGRSTVLKWLRRYGDQDWRPAPPPCEPEPYRAEVPTYPRTANQGA